MQRLAILSLHTSPLAQPGTGDGGGMNVYVRELASGLARIGNHCDVFTRADEPSDVGSVMVEPGFVVHRVEAGPRGPVAKEQLEALVPEFTDRVLTAMTTPSGGPISEIDGGPYDALHANYWLSGLVGHTIKHELDLPLVSTFHTLEKVKAGAGAGGASAERSRRRAHAEATVIGCSDAVLASCAVELDQLVELYGADVGRVAVIAPGVDHAFFAPGDAHQARRAVGLPEGGPVLLFVGRIQPLKGAHVAVETLAQLRGIGLDASLVVIGGPSGDEGEATLRDLHERAKALRIAPHVYFRPPQAHELLSSYYRAADVTVVPSRSESFGLVALESLACGTPVVASAVGGLTTLVDDGRTGALVEGWDPVAYAKAVAGIIDEPIRATRYSTAAVLEAQRYTWRTTATQLSDLFSSLVARRLVSCS